MRLMPWPTYALGVDAYAWTVHPSAEALVVSVLDDALEKSPRLRAFADDLRRATSTRLLDWVDHLAAPLSASALADAGFACVGPGLHRHPRAQLPALAAVDGPGLEVALRVDDVRAFSAVHGGDPEGDDHSGLRAVRAWCDKEVTLKAVERRSWVGGTTPAQVDVDAADRATALWRDRPRGFDLESGMTGALEAAEQMVSLVGPDLASSYAMSEERAYWMTRNRAARVQHERQDALGLGWGNQDHHTFRSSREGFADLLAVLALFGFDKRERFFAGADAGWGAQVLEHAGAGIVVFADVDLEPGEVDVDFTEGLEPSGRLGTVGTWCALHGESLLAAGMHHLEGQFDHAALVADLARQGIGHMEPFSTMPHLWQAFTEPDLWPVDRERLGPLVAAGHISAEAAERFATVGAPGSHLENLTRSGGFKGFNQHNVSTTIAATDPRAYVARRL